VRLAACAAVVLLGLGLLAGCGADADRGEETSEDGTAPAGGDDTPGPSSKDRAPLVNGEADPDGADGVSADLVGLIYPLDGTEHKAAWRQLQAAVSRSSLRTMGECLADRGYSELGTLVMVAEPAYPYYGHSLEDLNALRTEGLLPGQLSDGVEVLEYWFVESAEDDLVLRFAERPDYGVTPTVASVNEFITVYRSCAPFVQPKDSEWQIQEMGFEWVEVIREVDTRIEHVFVDFIECMQGTVFDDSTLVSLDTTLAAVDNYIVDRFGALDTDPEATLAELRVAGDQYADCLEPVVAERRKHLAAEREQVVQENFGALLAIEEWLADDSNFHSYDPDS